MEIAAVAGRGIGELARLRLRERDQILDCFRRHRVVHDQHEGRRDDERHRRKIAHGVERQLRKQGRIHYEWKRMQERRVAVGRRPRGKLGADVAVRPGAVIDEHALAREFRHLRSDETRHDVEAAAGRVGDDHAYRLGGIALGRGNDRLIQQGPAQPATTVPFGASAAPLPFFWMQWWKEAREAVNSARGQTTMKKGAASIMRLRRKIEPDPASPRYVRTERGVGYMFGVPVETVY